MFKFFEKADAKLQQDVTNELKWDPSITSTQVSVTAKDGIVTLRGQVPHYLEKFKAEEAAQRVAGVRAVADELDVDLLPSSGRSDQDIAEAAVTALEWHYQVPEGVKVAVEKGWVTLKGHVDWDYQRLAARDTCSMLLGVRGVTNEIAIKSKVSAGDVKTRIEDALKRSAEEEGRGIQVDVKGRHVTLTGNVHSLTDIELAQLAAWNAPGVTNVQNDLRISV